MALNFLYYLMPLLILYAFAVGWVLVRNIKLPRKVIDAVEAKTVAEQEAEKMRFVLQREQQEAQRKEVEAKDIAKANQIIAHSLTKEYLGWYYIKTLEGVISFPNNTIIILPQDYKGFTPMIMGK